MKIGFVLLSLLIITLSLYSQPSGDPINQRYKYGELGLAMYLSKNIKFPTSFVKNGTIGNSITRISVNLNGDLDSVCIINSIDRFVDADILKVLKSTRSSWIPSDSIKKDDVFYIQLVFSTRIYSPTVFFPKSKELKSLFLNPIIIRPQEPMMGNNTNEENHTRKFIRSEDLQQKANSLIESERFEEALPYIDELVKREPFNRELYKVRIMINIRLGNNSDAYADDYKLYDFAEGYSLDDIIREIDQQ